MARLPFPNVQRSGVALAILATATIASAMFTVPLAGQFGASQFPKQPDFNVMVMKDGRLPLSLTVWMKGRLVAESYGEVVVSLGRNGAISLEPSVDDTGAPIIDVLKKTDRLVGGGISSSLERFLCERNSHVCSIEGSGASSRFAWRIVRPTAQIRRPEQTQQVEVLTCPSAELPRHVVCLPRLTLQTGPGSITVPFKSGEDNLAEIVKATGACPVLDESCGRWVRRLNRRDEESDRSFPTRYTGPLVVPATEYRIELPVSSAGRLDQLTRTLDEVIRVLSKRYDWPEKQRFLYYTAQNPLTSFGAFSQPSSPAKPALEVMNYPFPDRKAFSAEKFDPVVVGVWDRHVDDEHCGYLDGADRAIVFPQPLPKVATGDDPRFLRGPCGTERSIGLSLKWDHGTHVTGVIATRWGGAGIVGANPRAKIWAYEVSEARLQQEDPISQLGEHPQTPRMPDVVNISMGETDLLGALAGAMQSRLDQIVRGNSAQYLFVVAAGNAPLGGQPAEYGFGGPCRILPACISSETRAGLGAGTGVISVVALDSLGIDRLRGDQASNYGTAFDVAAVGESVSTIDGNARGTMRGTSVAAPYVSALASLLYGKVRREPPWAVKQRILYTAEFSEGLDEVVRYGRIHFRRALASLNRHALRVVPDVSCPAGCQYEGVVRTNPADEIVITGGRMDGRSLPRPIPIKTEDLRRVSRVKAEQDGQPPLYYVVYKENGELKKISAAIFDPNKGLPFRRDDDNAFRVVPISTIEDYTCSFEHGKR